MVTIIENRFDTCFGILNYEEVLYDFDLEPDIEPALDAYMWNEYRIDELHKRLNGKEYKIIDNEEARRCYRAYFYLGIDKHSRTEPLKYEAWREAMGEIYNIESFYLENQSFVQREHEMRIDSLKTLDEEIKECQKNKAVSEEDTIIICLTCMKMAQKGIRDGYNTVVKALIYEDRLNYVRKNNEAASLFGIYDWEIKSKDPAVIHPI